jgi:hypothetical protein
MSMHRSASDVPRWLQPDSDASAELRSLVRDASVLPDDGARIARLRSRLGPWLLTGAPVDAPAGDVLDAQQAGGSVPPAVSAGAVAPKVMMALIGASLAVSAAVAWPRLTTSSAPAAVSAPAAIVAPASTSAGTGGSAVAPELGDASPSGDHAVSPSGLERTPAAPSLRKEAKAASASPERGDSLTEQAALLSQARQRLDASPTEALRLLTEHARRFPNSTLSEERRLFTIQALAQSRRLDDAKRELELLERSSPASPHLPRARRLVAAKEALP